MAIGSMALAHFLIVLVIGIAVGLVFNRYARSWLARLGTKRTGQLAIQLPDKLEMLHAISSHDPKALEKYGTSGSHSAVATASGLDYRQMM